MAIPHCLLSTGCEVKAGESGCSSTWATHRVRRRAESVCWGWESTGFPLTLPHMGGLLTVNCKCWQVGPPQRNALRELLLEEPCHSPAPEEALGLKAEIRISLHLFGCERCPEMPVTNVGNVGPGTSVGELQGFLGTLCLEALKIDERFEATPLHPYTQRPDLAQTMGISCFPCIRCGWAACRCTAQKPLFFIPFCPDFSLPIFGPRTLESPPSPVHTSTVSTSRAGQQQAVLWVTHTVKHDTRRMSGFLAHCISGLSICEKESFFVKPFFQHWKGFSNPIGQALGQGTGALRVAAVPVQLAPCFVSAPAPLPAPAWFCCCRICSQGYLLHNSCWFWHAAPGPHLLFKYHSQKALREEKKKKKENEYEIFVAVWRYAHAHTTQTQQPGTRSLAAKEGRLGLRLSSKPPWWQSVLKGNPRGQH